MNAAVTERERLALALSVIPPDLDRDEWWRLAAGIKHELGDDGFDLFDRWSQCSDQYVATDARDTWKSLQPNRGITAATVYMKAKAFGFDPAQHTVVPIDPAIKAKRDLERQRRSKAQLAKQDAEYHSAATLAQAIDAAAQLASPSHPYLQTKGVQPHGLKIYRGPLSIAGMPCDGCLIVPAHDPDGTISTLEFISDKGDKRFLQNGRKSGSFFFIGDDRQVIGIGEGFATCATVHEIGGITTVVAFDNGNLNSVAVSVRAQFPDADILILADHDESGAGIKSAKAAASAAGARVATPRNGKGWFGDFNDLARDAGTEAVRKWIDTAAKTKKDRAPRSDDGCVPAGFTVSDRGVFYEEDDGTPHWVCSELHVRALVRDRASENWGRLLEWNDADRHPHVWALPMEMLRSDGADMRGELGRLGLEIAPSAKARNKLAEYVISAKPKARGRCVTRTGWHDGVFVFPDQTVGTARERVIFQAETVTRAYSQEGSLDDWRDGVARYCRGNTRLLLAVSMAFAGMMLQSSGQESGGLNIVGDSSTGKTTALRAACSVFGGRDFMQRWRATSNGLEGLAALHTDSLLVLDELAQVDAREAGEIAYMLANGSGKARAGRTGAARARQSWQLLFLSAGEIGLTQHMASIGKKAKAGQEVRLLEIPADAGAGFGLFESLHGMAGGAELSAVINEAAVRSYGTPAIAFLEKLSLELSEVELWLKKDSAAFLARHLPANANGQAHRACQRFALIGLAGEYATTNGITGWGRGEALQAAADCFAIWIENRGGSGNQEKASILAHVKAFFESHEESRFSDLNDATDRPTINRAGFRRTTESGTEYLVLPEVFKREICAGFDPRSVARILVESEWIRPSSDGKSQRSERLPGKGTTRVYVFTSALWEAQ